MRKRGKIWAMDTTLDLFLPLFVSEIATCYSMCHTHTVTILFLYFTSLLLKHLPMHYSQEVRTSYTSLLTAGPFARQPAWTRLLPCTLAAAICLLSFFQSAQKLLLLVVTALLLRRWAYGA